MNNFMIKQSVLREAAIQIIANPNDIVKVAGVVSKVKKWLLGLFSPEARRQMAEIESKHSKISGIVGQLSTAIADIEKAIDDVSPYAYDNAVKNFYKVIKELNSEVAKVNESAKEIIKNKEAVKKETPHTTKNKKLLSKYKEGAAASSFIKDITNLKIPNKNAIYNSLMSKVLGGMGGGGLGKLIGKDISKENAEKIVNELRDMGFAETVYNNILNYKIFRVCDPRESQANIYEADIFVSGQEIVNTSFGEFKINIIMDIGAKPNDAFVVINQFVNEVSKTLEGTAEPASTEDKTFEEESEPIIEPEVGSQLIETPATTQEKEKPAEPAKQKAKSSKKTKEQDIPTESTVKPETVISIGDFDLPEPETSELVEVPPKEETKPTTKGLTGLEGLTALTAPTASAPTAPAATVVSESFIPKETPTKPTAPELPTFDSKKLKIKI